MEPSSNQNQGGAQKNQIEVGEAKKNSEEIIEAERISTTIIIPTIIDSLPNINHILNNTKHNSIIHISNSKSSIVLKCIFAQNIEI